MWVTEVAWKFCSSVAILFTSRRVSLELTWGTLLKSWTILKRLDLHGHIIYQINGHAKTDFLVVVPDLYGRRRRRQRHKRVRRPHPEPQEPLYIDILYIKMILMSSTTSW